MKRNFKISSFRINPSTITNNASFRFRVYINLINYFERVFRGVLIFVACYYIEQSSTYCRAIDDNSNSSSFFANSKWYERCPHFRKRITLCITQCHLRSATERFVIPRQTPCQVSILALLATSVGIGI